MAEDITRKVYAQHQQGLALNAVNREGEGWGNRKLPPVKDERQSRLFLTDYAVDPGQHYQLTTRHAHSDAVAADACQNYLNTVDAAALLVIIACDQVPAHGMNDGEGRSCEMVAKRRTSLPLSAPILLVELHISASIAKIRHCKDPDPGN